MLVLALASPQFLGDGLSVTLAWFASRSLPTSGGDDLPEPFSLSFHTLTCPEDIPEENPVDFKN